jgi:MFS family permease
MFVLGVVPALLVLPFMRQLQEPERWKKLVAEGQTGQQLGSYAELFGDPRWRRHAILGMLLGFAGVVGLWGIGFFSPSLTGPVMKKAFEAEGYTGAALNGKITTWRGISMVVQNLGGFVGITIFSWLARRTGRRPAFAVAFLLAPLATAGTFLYLDSFADMFWMLPVMGACQLMLFGGYAIYFPELFPTRLRSTGTSLCYNVGRFAAAVGPFGLGVLTSTVFTRANGYAEPIRYAGATMCGVFLIGLLALPFAPETKGKPLPE